MKYPQRDSNPCFSLERAATWTASRWGQMVDSGYRPRGYRDRPNPDKPGRSAGLVRVTPGPRPGLRLHCERPEQAQFASEEVHPPAVQTFVGVLRVSGAARPDAFLSAQQR